MGRSSGKLSRCGEESIINNWQISQGVWQGGGSDAFKNTITLAHSIMAFVCALSRPLMKTHGAEAGLCYFTFTAKAGNTKVSRFKGVCARVDSGGWGEGRGEGKLPFLYFRPHWSGVRACIMLTIRTTKVYFKNDPRSPAGRGSQRPRTWVLNIQCLK